MKEKIKTNSDNDIYQRVEEYFNEKEESYPTENEEYFPEKDSKPPHY